MSDTIKRVRSSAHAAFASRIRAGLEKKGWTRTRLADEIGVTATMVGYWRNGRYLPHPSVAERLAEALDDPFLLVLVTRARTVRCPCGNTFDRQQTKAMYCSESCQRKAHLKGGTKAPDPRQLAIDAMCRDCEPLGTCRDDGCALRPFSPFLFIPIAGMRPPKYTKDQRRKVA